MKIRHIFLLLGLILGYFSLIAQPTIYTSIEGAENIYLLSVLRKCEAGFELYCPSSSQITKSFRRFPTGGTYIIARNGYTANQMAGGGTGSVCHNDDECYALDWNFPPGQDNNNFPSGDDLGYPLIAPIGGNVFFMLAT